ncbi:unnamed protein product [Coffea canephora]|uniref:Uncharacterized protein n=1 Tax=Coffea canephora TaxID=49390 RepID=A0A068UCU6_COFCA|nr:unnamed protein product [Coffea canephora]
MLLGFSWCCGKTKCDLPCQRGFRGKRDMIVLVRTCLSQGKLIYQLCFWSLLCFPWLHISC